MLKYKREEFLTDSRHRGFVISGLFAACAAVDLARMYRSMSEYMDSGMGTLVPALLFLLLAVFLLLSGLAKAGKRRRTAMESRHNFIQNGIVSHGTIAAAGGGYYQKGRYRQQHVRRQQSRHFHTWESRWWAEIEYYDETKGTYARYRAMELNRNAKRYLGRDVDVYRLDDLVYVKFS